MCRRLMEEGFETFSLTTPSYGHLNKMNYVHLDLRHCCGLYLTLVHAQCTR